MPKESKFVLRLWTISEILMFRELPFIIGIMLPIDDGCIMRAFMSCVNRLGRSGIKKNFKIFFRTKNLANTNNLKNINSLSLTARNAKNLSTLSAFNLTKPIFSRANMPNLFKSMVILGLGRRTWATTGAGRDECVVGSLYQLTTPSSPFG